METANAVVIDDHLMVSESFKALLKKTGKFGHVTNFNSIDEARNELQQHNYHYLFTDVLMRGHNVAEFISFVREKWPGMAIIVVTTETDTDGIRELFGIGVNAYLSKSVGSLEVKMAMEKINVGEKYVSSDIASRLINSVFEGVKHKLSKRELEVLRTVADGKSIIEAADLLNISQHTVIAHRRNIMEKLGLHSATEMVKYAFEHHLYQ